MFAHFIFSILFILALPHTSYSSDANPASESDPTCASTPADPYEFPARFTKNSKQLRDQCLDTQRYRAARNVEIKGNTITFNNYLYKAQFWKAEVPNNGAAIESVLFHIKRFDVIKGVKAAHTQLRFRFKKDFPILLTNQVTGEKAQTNDVLVTYEATLTKGAGYNFALGAMPNYALVARVGDTLSIATEKKGTAIEQYELDLNSSEKLQLLSSNIQRSEEIAQTSFYNTLRPNCTSEVFDRLDSLPRLKGKFARFLTMISNDPVAGPAIDALRTRGILKQRIQNFDEEIAGATRNNLPIEQNKFEAPSFFPIVDGNPWTIALVVPNLDRIPAADREALTSLKTKLLDKTLEFLQSYNSTLMASDDLSVSSSQILSGTIETFQKEFVSSLKLINENMPNDTLTFAAYFVPMAKSSENGSLSKFGFEVAVPLNARVAIIGPDNEDRAEKIKSSEFYYSVMEGTLKAADVGSKLDTPAYLMGLAIVVNAVKNNSAVTVQVMTGINSIDKAFEKKNPQVEINKMMIPKGLSRSERPTAVLSFHQKLGQPLEKKLNLEFGPSGGIAGSLDRSKSGTFQVLKPLGFTKDSCEIRVHSVPLLTGVLGPEPTKNSIVNRMLQGKKIAFQVTDAVLDVEKFLISKLEINVATWPMDCVASSDVNNQFLAEANQAIKDFQGEQDLKAQAVRSLMSVVIGN